MHDLRRQALSSGKTVSRKAMSREASRATSRASSAHNSHSSSRNASRYPSDDEDLGSQSDDTAWSTASLDDLADNPDRGNDQWAEELADRIQEILDRKRSSVQGREESLSAYCRLSKYHFVADEIRSKVSDLLAAFGRSIKYESSVRETTLALRAIELLTVTSLDETIYENVEPLLTRTIRDSTSNSVKAAAIHCLGTCTFFGGAGEDGHLEQMTFFLDIIASDGQSIGAVDDAASVTAALQEWGFLATEIEDLEEESEEAVGIFTDQLDSSEPSVQIAAGENIALLYEKSYTPQEDDDDEGEDTQSDSDLNSNNFDEPKLVKRYNAYHNTPELERQLQSLASISSKRINKKDRKSLHNNFTSILTTVENPRRGPMYSTAIDQDTNRHYGSKRTIKIGREGIMNIDRWWKWIRLASLRRILQGGFTEHYYQGNHAVLDNLPVMMRASTQLERHSAKRAKDRGRLRTWEIEEG
ncbi:IFRD domain protein [Paecilomyces variotii No. 5]|uniref:IFRD domain protein n=1 Tax=Byssochlamys spectabilis (strain No. 5 / NBRC 109023) TaxID=1356009 RepID=V5FK71_BYSSN|nr:IFRD domain protein [Paecilomyces variotii No. 5]